MPLKKRSKPHVLKHEKYEHRIGNHGEDIQEYSSSSSYTRTFTENNMNLKLYEHWYSKRSIEDEDFYDDLREKKKSTKYHPLHGGIILGGLGGVTGHALTHGSKSAAARIAGPVAGAAGLGYLGYRLGKHEKDKNEREVDKFLKRYESASPTEKKYLRKRLQDREAVKRDREKTAAMQAIAWNTAWH